MIEMLLLVLIVLLWLILRKKKDWYVVEWRFCSDKELASSFLCVPRRTITKSSMEAHKLARIMCSHHGVRFQDEKGDELQVERTVFESLDAALLSFERSKTRLGYMADMPFQKLYLQRVVEPSRAKALDLPPSKLRYWVDDDVLVEYPAQFWTNFNVEVADAATKLG